MTVPHHTRSRSEWIFRFEQHLALLTSGALPAGICFEFACEGYEKRYDDSPESAAENALRSRELEDDDAAIAACSAIFLLRKFRLTRHSRSD